MLREALNRSGYRLNLSLGCGFGEVFSGSFQR
jgi:hypothetical protein